MDYSETQNCAGSRSNLLTTRWEYATEGASPLQGIMYTQTYSKVNVVSTGHLLFSEGRWKLVEPTKHTRKVYTHSKRKSNMHDYVHMHSSH